MLIFTIKPRPCQPTKIEAKQQNEWKQDVIEFEDMAYLEARGVLLDDYFNTEVLVKFRARPDDKSEALGKLKDILAYDKIKEEEKNQDVKDVLDESKFEEPPGMIGKGDKEMSHFKMRRNP